jgi:hypothetical protein
VRPLPTKAGPRGHVEIAHATQLWVAEDGPLIAAAIHAIASAGPVAARVHAVTAATARVHAVATTGTTAGINAVATATARAVASAATPVAPVIRLCQLDIAGSSRCCGPGLRQGAGDRTRQADGQYERSKAGQRFQSHDDSPLVDISPWLANACRN